MALRVFIEGSAGDAAAFNCFRDGFALAAFQQFSCLDDFIVVVGQNFFGNNQEAAHRISSPWLIVQEKTSQDGSV